MDLARTEFLDCVGVVTMDHSDRRNALSKALIADVLEAFSQMRSAKARAVVLRAPAGVKVWSAGHDVRELPAPGRDPLAYDDPLEQLVRSIRQFPAPVIGMIEGSVWGGACEVCVACDMLVGTPSVTFAATPAKIGVPYNTHGLLNLLSALGPRALKEMLFTATPISAHRAFELGILNHLVEADEIESFTIEMAVKIAENSPLSISAMKEQIRILQNAAPLSPETFERLQGLRRTVYNSHDYREGVQAFLDKRKPRFTGA